GTKLKLAFVLDKHDTVGIDCVAMCVNDLACAGGEPLFFLDYIACGRNIPERIAQIVKGVAAGCTQAGAALIGGETAEHPGLMPEDEYDLAGFAVGLAEEKALITGAGIVPGDALIGLASSGVHSNGFSLIRKIFDINAASLNTRYECLGRTLGEALLEPTKIYVRALRSVKESGVVIKGCSHITGGGFYENIPRMLPEGVCAVINNSSYDTPPIFKLIQETGSLSDEVMYNTYNMGLGMVLAVAAEEADKAVAALEQAGEKAYIVGHIASQDSCEAAEGSLCLC
ncbi:MAG: phosphoribosylformylglycinamidine cyclo-ligase, partial [Lachnospiraceae bacterium]|nr:phosphoribosylformylglycinamidine cyclo-ligase [Lachnospiraceae bacterium]